MPNFFSAWRAAALRAPSAPGSGGPINTFLQCASCRSYSLRVACKRPTYDLCKECIAVEARACTYSLHTKIVVARTQLLLSTLREDVARRPLDAEGAAAVAGAAGHTALSKVRRAAPGKKWLRWCRSWQGAHGLLDLKISMLMQSPPSVCT